MKDNQGIPYSYYISKVNNKTYKELKHNFYHKIYWWWSYERRKKYWYSSRIWRGKFEGYFFNLPKTKIFRDVKQKTRKLTNYVLLINR